jgi:hypothetical protein
MMKKKEIRQKERKKPKKVIDAYMYGYIDIFLIDKL